MKEKKRPMEALGLFARLGAGGVLAYAGILKTLAPAEEFAFAIESYRILGPQLSLYAAYVTPWIELWAGLLLMAGVFTRASALFCGGMFVFFQLLLAQAMIRGLPVTSCGCFGASGSNSIGHEFVQNLVILALIWLAWKYGKGWSADRYVDRL